LLLALFKAFKLEMLAVIIPRLCLVGLSIAQPFMIGRTVTFLQDTSTSSNNTGYGLLGAFILVFILTAVSTAVYQHLGYRVMTMLRGGLIATLYNHMMCLPVESVSESAALSLMSSDAEAFAEYFHATITDSWANLLQLGIAIYLLARMIGAIVVAPVTVAVRKFEPHSVGMNRV
jgi:ABC-type multidrug transport system fused ATPase/permease subunit